MFGIYLDHRSGASITSQLCSQIRSKIQTGELAEGTRLPPTRKLAQEYGIARNVVIDVYEQLTAEGYLIGQIGSGTYVAGGIASNEQSFGAESEAIDVPELAESGKGTIDFATGTPDLRHFPQKMWAKYLKAAMEAAPAGLLDYGHIMGDDELRAAIAAYLLRVRGMRCHPGQIIIVSGSSDGLALIARALYPQYRSVYLEDPTIEFAQNIFRHMNYRIAPVEVDRSGMKLHEIDRFEPGHLMLLTPSHQFPSGSILSIQRRQHAVKLAEQADSYIIEDDYDSDFRLKGVPIPPMHTLSPSRVIYVGTFSKTLAPGLRIGFLAVPRHLAGIVANVKEELNLRTPCGFAKRSGPVYPGRPAGPPRPQNEKPVQQRRSLLIAALKNHFGEQIAIGGDEAGMHLQVEFPREQCFAVDWQQSASYGVKVHGVEDYCLVKGKHANKILLGYGNVREEDIEPGIERLRRFVEERSALP
ncbi:MocR-like pyridoxine biosynthesis transcription factor PdxR [Gordoniibacillus kamchatkensis]|uniref:MocR-like pyridoxine biosynthesis transcription factor PdxR n=1 Tax=Gordoniibacillus kamchatkensis TaxID=1590651 RepID=UPI000B1040D7|nr:PLP-dependent aminotransferase family protein [Paenibacillus sp. VKM B-2647]